MARLALLVLTSLLAVPTAAEAAPRPIPLVSCVDRAASGGQEAVFQARLGGRHAVRVRAGSDNRVTGGRVVGKRRQVFKPGRHTVLRVRFRSGSTAIRWRLRGRTATAAGRTSSCLRGTPHRVGGAQPAPPAAPAPAEPPVTAVGISADPELQPAFTAGTPDYVTRCGGSKPVTMKVATPEDKPVSVDGNPAQTGRFEVPVSVTSGQRFDFKVGADTYHVRCLPADFPRFTATVAGTPQAEFFFVAPSLFALAGNYAAIFDAHGAPVWWVKADAAPLDFKLLSNGNVGFFASWLGSPRQFNELRLDGTFVLGTNTVGTATDTHDYVELPNGNRYLMSYRIRDHADVSAETGQPEDSDAVVLEAEVQELDPAGNLVWSWNSHGHIPLSETGHWFEDYPAGKTDDGRNIYDINHINSIEPDGDGIIVSMRHNDALYRIDKVTGDITWKLGGTPRAESLTIIGDDGNVDFGGQHDARLLPDGTLTLHDNATGKPRSPRALRFKLDLSAGTATLVESVSDPLVGQSACCGSARKLPGGDWVMSWGNSSVVTELSPNGDRPYLLEFERPIGSYRADPVLPGKLDIAAVRAGMDAQHPRP